MEQKLNLGIVAHADAGKTSITDRLLFESGLVRRAGAVDEGTSVTDWLPIEKERGISVKASLAFLKKDEQIIHLVDTPGHVDFLSEIERALSVLDGALLVVSAAEGIQAQTELLWRALRRAHIPTMIFINKIDRSASHVSAVMADMVKRFSSQCVLLESILEEGSDQANIGALSEDGREELFLALGEHQEDLLEDFMAGTSIPTEKIIHAIRRQTAQESLFPVLCGSALKNVGMHELYEGLFALMPPKSYQAEGPLAGFVYAVEHRASLGKMCYVKLLSGTLAVRDRIAYPGDKPADKVKQMKQPFGKKLEDVSFISAGDVAVVLGMDHAKVGDGFGEQAAKKPALHLAEPLLNVKVIPQMPDQIMALKSAIDELCEEDPLLNAYWQRDKQEIVISILGMVQLEVLKQILWERFELSVSFSAPSVIYKETLAKKSIGYVHYTMPKPCWAVLKFEMEPLPPGSGIVYKSTVPNDQILYRYQHQVEQTILSSLKQGMHGWQVIDIGITLVDGEYHVEHTHPLDFVVATPMGIMDGLKNGGTILLEPIMRWELTAQNTILNTVIGEIVRRRGTTDTPQIGAETFLLTGRMPAAESVNFPTYIASLSKGRGQLSMQLDCYEPCPPGYGEDTAYRGVNPLDRAKYILHVRGAVG